MVNFGYPYNDIVICKDSTDYLHNVYNVGTIMTFVWRLYYCYVEGPESRDRPASIGHSTLCHFTLCHFTVISPSVISPSVIPPSVIPPL